MSASPDPRRGRWAARLSLRRCAVTRACIPRDGRGDRLHAPYGRNYWASDPEGHPWFFTRPAKEG